MVWNCMKSTRFIDKNPFPLSSGVMSEWADKRMSAAERASDASIAELANEWAERVNEQAEERMQMAQYSMRPFQIISTHSGIGRYT